MITRVNVSKLPIDDDLKELTIELKKYIDTHSFYGKFCTVDVSRTRWDGMPIPDIKATVAMFPCIYYRVTSVPLQVEKGERETLEIIKTDRWKQLFAAYIDIDFTKQLAKQEYIDSNVERVVFNKVEMYTETEAN